MKLSCGVVFLCDTVSGRCVFVTIVEMSTPSPSPDARRRKELLSPSHSVDDVCLARAHRWTDTTIEALRKKERLQNLVILQLRQQLERAEAKAQKEAAASQEMRSRLRGMSRVALTPPHSVQEASRCPATPPAAAPSDSERGALESELARLRAECADAHTMAAQERLRASSAHAAAEADAQLWRQKQKVKEEKKRADDAEKTKKAAEASIRGLSAVWESFSADCEDRLARASAAQSALEARLAHAERRLEARGGQRVGWRGGVLAGEVGVELAGERERELARERELEAELVELRNFRDGSLGEFETLRERNRVLERKVCL